MEHNPVLAYLAGFLDGDGCIRVSPYQHKPTNQLSYHLKVSAAQLEEHREPLDILSSLFGGKVRKMKRYAGRPLLQWELSGVNAARLVKMCFPYFTVKRDVAFVALLFAYHKEEMRQSRRIGEPCSAEEIVVGRGCNQLTTGLNGQKRTRLLRTSCSNQIN